MAPNKGQVLGSLELTVRFSSSVWTQPETLQFSLEAFRMAEWMIKHKETPVLSYLTYHVKRDLDLPKPFEKAVDFLKKYEDSEEASARKLKYLEENLHLRLYISKGDAIRSAICNAYLLNMRHDLMFIYTRGVRLAILALPNLLKSIDELHFQS